MVVMLLLALALSSCGAPEGPVQRATKATPRSTAPPPPLAAPSSDLVPQHAHYQLSFTEVSGVGHAAALQDLERRAMMLVSWTRESDDFPSDGRPAIRRDPWQLRSLTSDVVLRATPDFRRWTYREGDLVVTLEPDGALTHGRFDARRQGGKSTVGHYDLRPGW